MNMYINDKYRNIELFSTISGTTTTSGPASAVVNGPVAAVVSGPVAAIVSGPASAVVSGPVAAIVSGPVAAVVSGPVDAQSSKDLILDNINIKADILGQIIASAPQSAESKVFTNIVCPTCPEPVACPAAVICGPASCPEPVSCPAAVVCGPASSPEYENKSNDSKYKWIAIVLFLIICVLLYFMFNKSSSEAELVSDSSPVSDSSSMTE